MKFRLTNLAGPRPEVVAELARRTELPEAARGFLIAAVEQLPESCNGAKVNAFAQNVRGLININITVAPLHLAGPPPPEVPATEPV
jgi:hypothetical protein